MFIVYAMFKKPCSNGKCLATKSLPKHFSRLETLTYRDWSYTSISSDKIWKTGSRICKTCCSFGQCSNKFDTVVWTMFKQVWYCLSTQQNIDMFGQQKHCLIVFGRQKFSASLERASVTCKCSVLICSRWHSDAIRVPKSQNLSWSCYHLKPAGGNVVTEMTLHSKRTACAKTDFKLEFVIWWVQHLERQPRSTCFTTRRLHNDESRFKATPNTSRHMYLWQCKPRMYRYPGQLLSNSCSVFTKDTRFVFVHRTSSLSRWPWCFQDLVRF